MFSSKLNVIILTIHLILQTPHCIIYGYNFTVNNEIQRQRQLHKEIMAEYNPYIMPPLINDEPMIVSLSVYMLELEDVNVKRQSFKARSNIKIEWNDQQLKWDPENYAGTTQIYIPNEKIWKPDLYVISSFELDIGLEGVLANVHYDGYVNVWAFCVQTVSCDINIKAYPFDTQECAFDIGSWIHPVSELIFQGNQQTIDSSLFSESGQWHFTSTDIQFTNFSFENDTYNSISFPFRIHRKILFDFMNTITPCILTSLLTVLIFKLPTESGERISLSITLFLTTAVFMTVVNNSLPRNSDQVSVLEIYLTIQIISSVAAIILTIHSISLLHIDSSRPVPMYIELIMKRFGKRPNTSYKIDYDTHTSRERSDSGKHNVLMTRESDDISSSRNTSNTSESVHISETFDRLYFYTYIMEFVALHLWLLAVGLTNSNVQ